MTSFSSGDNTRCQLDDGENFSGQMGTTDGDLPSFQNSGITSAEAQLSSGCGEEQSASQTRALRPKINFRARWELQARSRRDDMSILDEMVSQSMGSDGSVEDEPHEKKIKMDRLHDPRPQKEEPAPNNEEVSNIARLAAMEQLRKHDLKMPWEKGPLAPILMSEMPSSLFSSSSSLPRVGLADTLSPMATVKQDTPAPSGAISVFAKKTHCISQGRCTRGRALSQVPQSYQDLAADGPGRNGSGNNTEQLSWGA